MSTEAIQKTTEMFLCNLDEEKRRYIKELDVMSDVVSLAMEKINNNPDIEETELENLLNDEKIQELLGPGRELLNQALKQFIRRRETIKRYYSEYKDNPGRLFQELTGFKLFGEVELIYNGWVLIFVLKDSDMDKSGRSADSTGIAGGGFFTRGHPSIKIPELSGKVCFIRSNIGSYQRTRVEIQSVVKHESNHAFWRDYLRETKEGSLTTRTSLDKRLILDEDTGIFNIADSLDKLSPLEKAQAAEFIVRLYLDDATDLYFTGDRHREHFVREGGPWETVRKLAEEMKESHKGSDNIREIEDFFETVVKLYYKYFFILFDVLQQVNDKISRTKLEALCCLLPSDRVERLLYFINVNPKRWLEEWLANNSLAELKKRELRLRIEEDDWGGI